MNEKSQTDKDKEIIALLIEEKINPVIAEHGGSIEMTDYTDGVLTIRFDGACAWCPGKQGTLKNSIEPFLKDWIEDLKEVKFEENV